MTGAAVRRRPVRHWYRDYLSCLQSTVASVLLHLDIDPLEALGLYWGFTYIPGDIRLEEYYLPCRRPGDLVGSLLPHHPVTSTWRRAPSEEPVTALEKALADGQLPIAAVDNFHLPFRPAYRDVHAAHLLLVYEVDRERGTVGVSDAMPPSFLGPLPIDDLVRSWTSGSPSDAQDVFFSGTDAPAARWLDVRVDAAIPPLTHERLLAALRRNVEDLRAGQAGRGPALTGLAGLSMFCRDVQDLARSGDGDGLAAAYTFGWSAQAQASLHGELLRGCGARWGRPDLAEAGRLVEHAAHLWTPLRVTAAHGRVDPRRWSSEFGTHTRALSAAYHAAVDAIDHAV